MATHISCEKCDIFVSYLHRMNAHHGQSKMYIYTRISQPKINFYKILKTSLVEWCRDKCSCLNC
jgi:hypothetical protein